MKTHLHGLLDLIIAISLILIPFLLSFPEGKPTGIPILVGVTLLVVNLMTDYEWGILKIIPMGLHIVFDILLGFFLLMSPWAFDLGYNIFWSFTILGFVLIIIAILTLVRPHKLHGRYQDENIFMEKDY